MFGHSELTSYSLVTGLPGSTPEMMFPVLYTVLVMVELRLLDNEDLSLFNMSILIVCLDDIHKTKQTLKLNSNIQHLTFSFLD